MRSVVLCTISINQMAGGLEKNIIALANYLVHMDYQVHLITFDQPGASSFFEVDQKITWNQVARTSPHSSITFWQRLKLIYRIRIALKAAGRPIVVCFHHGTLPRMAISSVGLNLKLVCSERNSLSLYDHISQKKWSAGFIMLVFANRITVQFTSYIKDYPWWLRRRIRVIPNPVYPVNEYADTLIPNSEGRFCLLNVGRLSAQKSQRMLIDAFASICERHPLWDLKIVGDGELGAELMEHIRILGLENRIFLVGKRRDVAALMASSHLYCMPSKWEGFPNALAEAMSHGLPCVGLLSCPGVRDLINDRANGLLTNSNELSVVLDYLMCNHKARHALGLSALNYIGQFTSSKSFQHWEEILRDIEYHP